MPVADRRSPLTILAGSGVALFLIMLLPWYKANLGVGAAVLGEGSARNAWSSFAYTDLLLLFAVLAALASFALAGQRHPQAPNAIQLAAVLGVFDTLLVLYRIINPPGDNSEISVEIGAYLGLIAAAGVAYGGLRSMRQHPRVDPGES